MDDSAVEVWVAKAATYLETLRYARSTILAHRCAWNGLVSFLRSRQDHFPSVQSATVAFLESKSIPLAGKVRARQRAIRTSMLFLTEFADGS